MNVYAATFRINAVKWTAIVGANSPAEAVAEVRKEKPSAYGVRIVGVAK